MASNNEKKNLLVSLSNSSASSSNKEGYSTLNTITTPLSLPLSNLESSSKLHNTLLSPNKIGQQNDRRKNYKLRDPPLPPPSRPKLSNNPDDGLYIFDFFFKFYPT
jgi:hypothetical protein